MSDDASADPADDPADKISGQTEAPSETPRASLLDLFEQQIHALRAQAEATSAACALALTTVGVMRTQADTVRRAIEEQRANAKLEADAPPKPATFGARRQAPSSTIQPIHTTET